MKIKALLSAMATAAAVAPIVATAAAFNLYVSVSNIGDGGTINEYTSTGAETTFAPQNRPRGLAFDSTGNLFAASTDLGANNGTIHKFAPNGVQNNFGGSPAFLEGLAVDGAGDVFVVRQGPFTPGFGFPSTILEFTPGGTRSVFASGFNQSFDLAFDSAGNLYLTDSFDQTIFKFTPGRTESIFAGPSAFGSTSIPVGLAFDSAGNLFVSTELSPGSDEILEFTPGGIESTFATGLNNPRGLAFDSSGNLFAVETGSGAGDGDILKFTPSGSETVFASGLTNPEFLTFGPARGPAGPNVPDSGATFGLLTISIFALFCVRKMVKV